MTADAEHELRCFCRRRPLLALAGAEPDGSPFVHMRVHKQGRIYGEMVAHEGVIELRCRECLRWHRVVIRKDGVQLKETRAPLFLAN